MNKIEIDSQSIEISCPHCSHKTGKTIGQLKTMDTLKCPRCSETINLDKAQIRTEAARVQRQIDAKINKATQDLRKALGRLGK